MLKPDADLFKVNTRPKVSSPHKMELLDEQLAVEGMVVENSQAMCSDPAQVVPKGKSPGRRFQGGLPAE